MSEQLSELHLTTYATSLRAILGATPGIGGKQRKEFHFSPNSRSVLFETEAVLLKQHKACREGAADSVPAFLLPNGHG